MFKIGYRAIYESSIQSAIKIAKRNRFEVLEIHLSSPQFNTDTFTSKDFLNIINLAKKEKIILQVHAPLEQSLLFAGRELREGARHQLRTLINFSQKIQARCLTIHPGKVSVYNTADGRKIKADEKYPKYYDGLFKDSLRQLISLAPKDLFICLENTDNFTSRIMKIISKFLPSGKIFLTWDIMKNFTYTNHRLISEQWNFFKKNIKFIKNIHASGFSHGSLEGWERRMSKFLAEISEYELPIIVEVYPLAVAIEGKKIIEKAKIYK